MTKSKDSRTGYVSLVGKTNVGKSTLLNQMVEQKISITSRKPQTTRHRLLGIKTKDYAQAIFIDTPGFHQGQKRALNRYMNKVAIGAMSGVDVLLYVIEALKFDQEDEKLLTQIPANLEHVILVINKVDRIFAALDNFLHHLCFIELEVHSLFQIGISGTRCNVPWLEVFKIIFFV